MNPMPELAQPGFETARLLLDGGPTDRDVGGGDFTTGGGEGRGGRAKARERGG